VALSRQTGLLRLVERWEVDDLDEHDQVIDHIEDEHAWQIRAQTDIPVAGAVGAVRWACV
jgi:hypothetical protein